MLLFNQIGITSMDKLIKTVDAIYSKYWRKDNIETYAVAAKKLLQKKQKAMTAVLDVAQEMEQIQKANVLEEEKELTHKVQILFNQ